MERRVELFLRGGKFRSVIEGQTESLCRKYGIKLIDAEIILCLLSFPDQDTARDIQGNLPINKGYLSRRLDELCRMDLLSARTDPDDRRYVHYSPGPASPPLIEELISQREETMRMILRDISEEELELLRQITEKIERNIRELASM